MAQINKPNTYFNTVLYSGNGGTQSITGVNFQPDLVYIKGRNTTLKYPTMFDSVRGASKRLMTHLTNAEDTHVTMLTSFDSDGWSSGSDDQTNASGTNYVCWNWLAGGTAVSNTDGSITSSVSANTTSGFSIVAYTGTASAGATVGHGLGVAPSVVILKNRTGYDWQSYWSALGNTRSMVLNSTSTGNTGVGFWNNTNPSSSVVTLGNDGSHSGNCVMYCFAEKKGFSKFGSYVGNGSADGTFVYTGFKPAWLVIKRSSSSGTDWYMFDNKRNTYNVTNNYLDANTSDIEASNISLDFVSNGFKLRDSQTVVNQSGGTFIYMAFAENPLVGTNNIPATAR